MVKYFYNIILKDDVCDLFSDVLTDIRKKYHLSKLKQKRKLAQYNSGDPIFYDFCLEKNKCIKWHISNLDGVISDSRKLQDGKYCISYYVNNNIAKVLTFSKYHTLLKIEYFNLGEFSLDTTSNCIIEPRKAHRDLCLLLKDNDKATILYAMPQIEDEFLSDKINLEFKDFTAVASTDIGIVKFLSKEQLQLFDEFLDNAKNEKALLNEPRSYVDDIETVLAQKLNPKDFNMKRNLSQVVDITCASDFFSDDSDGFSNVELSKNDTSQYSDTVLESKSDETDEEVFDITIEKLADKVIYSTNSKYYYYGELDSDHKRSGYGRTATENGRTAYEGEYADNKRNGVGSYYYKDGTLCYYGDWKDNKREGFGVGISSFDKSIHVGEFSNNKPVGDGVRLDKNGKIRFINKTLDNGLIMQLSFDGDKIVINGYSKDGKIVIENSSDIKDL